MIDVLRTMLQQVAKVSQIYTLRFMDQMVLTFPFERFKKER